MVWTYSGDPSSSALDEYRFKISDTDISEPILQDGEIQYILDNNPGENQRMFLLFRACATLFARDIKKSLGPQSQDPTARTNYYASQAKKYEGLLSAAGIGPQICSKPIFRIGMHDSIRR